MDGHVRIPDSPYRRIALFLSILLLCSFGYAFAQNPCVELNLPGSDLLFSPPGQLLTAGVKITNRSPIQHHFSSQCILPAGWRNLTPSIDFDLPADGSDIHLISFVIPTGATSGPYQIQYSVRDTADTTCEAERRIVVFVNPTHRLILQILNAPRFIVSGRPDTVLFSVQNQGNEPAAVRVSGWTTEGLTVAPESTFTTLRAGESRELPVRLLSEPGRAVGVTQILRLKATQEHDSTTEANVSTQFQIIVGTLTAPKRYHEAPLQLMLRATGENQQSGGQIELAGAGTLTDGGKDQYSLFVRTPDIQNRSLLGSRDEYRFGYSGENFNVELGDQSYVLSPLTEFGRYAFGAGGSARVGDIIFGGFYNQTRFYSPAQKEEAVFTGYQLDEQSAVSLNYLHKVDANQSNVVTARAVMQPIRRNDLDLEYGISSRQDVTDRAFAAHLIGSQDWISYDLRYVHAGSGYAGYYSDVDSRSVSVNIRPWELLRIEGYARDETRNLLMDSNAATVAPLARVYQVGAGYGEYFSAYYRVVDQKDLFLVSAYDRNEHSLQLRSGYSFQSAGVVATVDLGSTLDRILAKSSPFQRYTLSGTFRPDNHQHYTASVEYTTERNLLTWDLLERWSGNLNVSFEIGESTRIQAGIFESSTGAPTVQTSTILDAELTHTLPFHHTIALRARRTIVSPGDQGPDVGWLLEYRIPLQIPITRLTTTGDLTGKVLDAVEMRGIPNIVVYAGSLAAMTNEYGEYSFTGLIPDQYHVRVDQAGIGFDRLTTAPMPLTVPVAGGQEAHADFYVVQGATVSGSVRLFEFLERIGADTSAPAYIDTEGLGNMLVELSSPTDTLRRLTDNQGRYRFPTVRPGEWVLTIRDGQYPENHYIERDTVTVALKSGDHMDELIRVLPRRRKIHILEEGKVEIEQKIPVQPHVTATRAFANCVISEDSTGAGFMVQSSSWKTSQKALRVADRMFRVTGMKPVVRSLPNGRSILVVGPFKTLQEAESACRQLGP